MNSFTNRNAIPTIARCLAATVGRKEARLQVPLALAVRYTSRRKGVRVIITADGKGINAKNSGSGDQTYLRTECEQGTAGDETILRVP